MQGNDNSCAARNLRSIKVPKDVLILLKLYSVCQNSTITDIATRVLEREMKEFKERMRPFLKLE